MERRRELRIKTDQPALLTVFGGAEQSVPARTLDYSGHGISLVVESPLPLGSAIKVETQDALLLGEVCYCYPIKAGFVLGLEIQQALMGLRELANLNSRLFEDSNAQPLIEDEAATSSGKQHRELRQRQRVGF